MERIIDLASNVEMATIELERIKNLVNIVITEVFDQCAPSNEHIVGTLGAYEHSFEAVLCAASEKAYNLIKDLEGVANELYERSKKKR